MVQVKVEHLIVVLLGLFLLYHFMGSCGCNKVEGWLTSPENYKYQMPYVMDDGKHCGVSNDYNQYYAKSKRYENLVTGSSLAEAKRDLAPLTKARESADSVMGEAQSLMEAALSRRDTYRSENPRPSGEGWATTEWDATDSTYETAVATTTSDYQLAQIAQTAAAAAESKQQEQVTNAEEIYNKKLDDELAKAKIICDKPNRMLYRYGPQYACAMQGEQVDGPDANFWKDPSVTGLMRIDTGANEMTTDTLKIVACEVKTPDQTDVSSLISAGGPFHGYNFKTSTPLATYEAAGVRYPADPLTKYPVTIIPGGEAGTFP